MAVFQYTRLIIGCTLFLIIMGACKGVEWLIRKGML